MAFATGIAALLSKLSLVQRLQALEARFSARTVFKRCCSKASKKKKKTTEDDALPAGLEPASRESFSDTDGEIHGAASDVDSESEDSSLLSNDKPSVQPQVSVHQRASLLARLEYSVLFVLFASHFELSNVILANLKPCEENHMPASPWIKCSWAGDSPQYVWLQGLTYVFLVLYVVGIPGLFFALLMRNRRKIQLEDSGVDHRFGFLYETYKRDVFFFEAIWLLRRVLLSIALALIPKTTGFRNASISLILLASLFIQQRFKPFSSGTVNTLETLTTTTLLYSFSVGTDLASNHAWAWRNLLQILLWIVNCLVVVVLAIAIIAPAAKRLLARLKCCRKQHSFKLLEEAE